MNAFLSGALGALAVLFGAATLRRLAWRRWRRHGRGRFGAVYVLRRIGARPEQERAVLAETDALADELRALRSEAHGLRADLAELLAAPDLDAARVAAALEARLVGVEALRTRFAAAVARIHAALDPAQRAALADLVRRGPHGGHRRHWRGAHA